MSNIFPTSYYPAKDILIDGDIVWGYDSAGIINRNFLLSAIKAYVLTGITTSEVAEGTNLYFTTTRVDTNATVVALGADKAAKTNVLELDNTTVFTPTADYHPATKLYVDNSGVNINGITEEVTIIDGDELIFYDASAAANRKIDYTDLKSAIEQGFVHNKTITASGSLKYSMNTERSSSLVTIVKVKEAELGYFHEIGSIRVTFDMKSTNSGEVTGQVYINGAIAGIEQSSTSTSYASFSQDLTSISANDIIQLYIKRVGSGDCFVQNFQISFDESIYTNIGSIITN